MTAIDQLVSAFSRLPGVGKKTAYRYVYYLLKTDQAYCSHLGKLIQDLQQSIRSCRICGNYSENEICQICTDSSRDKKVLCLVEEARDIQIFKGTEYNGLFHVLQGVLDPLNGIGPAQLNLEKLYQRLQSTPPEEIIIATNPTLEGDSTAFYLAEELKKRGFKVSRPAAGLPIGGDLEYADRLTINRSLSSRRNL